MHWLVTQAFMAYENAVMTVTTVKMIRLVAKKWFSAEQKFKFYFIQPSDGGFGSFSHQEIEIYTEKR